ncbi:MAG TPA: hypothetical protein VID48_04955 [Solirubrobacteraceae bacterium]|jgi:hypothetical protein
MVDTPQSALAARRTYPRALIVLAAVWLALWLLASSPANAKTKKHSSREKNVDATFSLELGPPETTLPATQTITLLVPKGIRDAGAKLPFCNPASLESRGEQACPKGSQIGSGTSTGYTLGVVEPLKLLLYNGPGGTLLTYVVGLDPVSIQTVVSGSVSKPGGSYGQQFSFTIPHGLLEPLPEDQAWLLTLHAHVLGKSGWLRSTSCPPHGWSFQARFGYTNGQTITIGASAECQ